MGGGGWGGAGDGGGGGGGGCFSPLRGLSQKLREGVTLFAAISVKNSLGFFLEKSKRHAFSLLSRQRQPTYFFPALRSITKSSRLKI